MRYRHYGVLNENYVMLERESALFVWLYHACNFKPVIDAIGSAKTENVDHLRPLII